MNKPIKTTKDILELVSHIDPTFRQEGNIYYAHKAFMINTVIKWCFNKIDSGAMKPNEMKFYLDAIVSYAQGNSGMYWDENGSLVIF
jgi:hypothetical protein